MKIFEFFLAALDTLWANRMRSSLTMIGIVIGTAAVNTEILDLMKSKDYSIRGRTIVNKICVDININSICG